MFFERPASGELAVLIHLDLGTETEPDDPREFEELVLSAGGDPVAFVTGQRRTPDSRFFVGGGKLEEVRELVAEHCAELVIFNHGLSPSQERNVERALGCRVLDRTGLILDIFAQRARTHEGKLQVELAQLEHAATRLVRGWTHLERQKGGIGTRGPGETQLETDRRLIRGRIKAIHKRLEKVRRQRDQGRRSRRKMEVPAISLVGYTNAGKSTLFNRLAEAHVLTEDKLFATLDPTMRRVTFPDVGPAILADTVGFISHLPHKLVDAFSATLEEAASASLLLHVIDVGSENRARNMESVAEVLEEIGARETPQLRVFNKIDRMPDVEPRVERDEQGVPLSVWVSAETGAGMDLLIDAIRERLSGDMTSGEYYLPPHLGRLRSRLFALDAVRGEKPCDDGGLLVDLRMPTADFNRLLKAEGLSPDALVNTGAGSSPEKRQSA